MANNNQVFMWLAIGVVVSLAMGWISLPDGMFSSGDGNVDNLYPSDLKTTITLNTGDELATSALNANVTYYVFDSNGKYLKEGTTSAGTASFTVPTGGNYEVLVHDDDGTGSDYLPTWTSFSTDGDDPTGRAVQTINVDVKKESTFNINSVQDPVDLNANVSVGLGQTVNYNILFSANVSNAAGKGAVILADINSSEIQSITLGGTSGTTCPNRIQVTAGHKFKCFLVDQIITSSDGIQTLKGTFVMDSSTAAQTTSGVNFRILDTGLYLESNYKTQGKIAFKENTENPVTDADLGAADSSVVFLQFNG